MGKRSCNEAKENLSPQEMVEVIRSSPPGPWPADWAKWHVTHEAHRLLADEFIEKIPPYPGGYKGRGIIIAAGANPLPHKGLPHGYMPCLWVLVNKLRRMGCNLPVQVWHLGPEEMDPFCAKLLRPFGVECVDAKAVERLHPARILCGWELKAFAAIHCPFKEVFFIDADNAPINVDPSFMFDTPEYVKAGSVFWPDYDCWTLQPGVWKVFGIPNRVEPAFETGQWMVNKEQCWRELQLSWFYNAHSDFVFRHVYGDKETFHLAWRKLGTEYAMPSTPPGWVEHTIVQHDFHGRQILLHRVQDKWRLKGGNRRVNLPDEDLHFRLVEQLREIWPGHLWRNTSPTGEERKAIRSLVGQRFTYRRIGLDERPVTLGPGGRITEGSAECEQRWDVHKDGEDFVMAISRDDRPTALLRAQGDGTWKGRWLEFEKCDTELIPLGVKSLTRDESLEGVISGFREVLARYAIEPEEGLLRDFVSVLVPKEVPDVA